MVDVCQYGCALGNVGGCIDGHHADVYLGYCVYLQRVRIRMHHGASLLAMDTLTNTRWVDVYFDNKLIYSALY
jgi:hypothetical protein